MFSVAGRDAVNQNKRLVQVVRKKVKVVKAEE